MRNDELWLGLYSSVTRGNGYLRNATRKMRNWRRSIRRRGGFWMATAEYAGGEHELLDLFLGGLMNEVREVYGGAITWQGVIVEMELALAGLRWQRSIFEVYNAARSIYSSIGNNLLTNGGGESGVWTAYGAPTTLEQSAAWRTEGVYSIHIVTGAGARGADIQQNAAINARTPYDARVSARIVSGVWMLSVVRADTGEALADTQTSEVGEEVLRCSVNDSNEFAGNVHIRVESVDATGEAYFDAAVFQRGPVRAETSWYEDLTSIVEFGRVEEILLRAGMTTDAATAEVQTLVATHAWPRSLPPGDLSTLERELQRAPDATLELTLAGYWATLNFLHTTASGTDDASNHVNALAGQAEFVTPGIVQSNTLPFQIDDRAPVRIGDVLGEIADAGDAGGNLWHAGVYEGRQLHYGMVEDELSYRYRAGRLFGAAGGVTQPWLVRPGWVHLDDAPVGRFAGGGENDDVRRVFAEEVEFEAPDIVRFRRNV